MGRKARPNYVIPSQRVRETELSRRERSLGQSTLDNLTTNHNHSSLADLALDLLLFYFLDINCYLLLGDYPKT